MLQGVPSRGDGVGFMVQGFEGLVGCTLPEGPRHLPSWKTCAAAGCGGQCSIWNYGAGSLTDGCDGGFGCSGLHGLVHHNGKRRNQSGPPFELALPPGPP